MKTDLTYLPKEKQEEIKVDKKFCEEKIESFPKNTIA